MRQNPPSNTSAKKRVKRHLFAANEKPTTEPAKNGAGAPGEVVSPSTRREGTRMKAILFVDDHEVLARLSCEILEMQGYRAVSAYNASDALEKFDQENFDILVTDFRMEGMNGLELARKVRAKRPDVPIIIVTGYGPVDGGNDINACLQKEELFPALLEKIKLFLGENDRIPPSSTANSNQQLHAVKPV
jgi:CheY-like chemotaxis protein